MGVALYLIIGSFTAIFFYLIGWANHHYGYWKRKGLKHPKPIYFLGNTIPVVKTPTELYTQLYHRYSKDKCVGFYEVMKIRLLIIDPALIQNILIRDFSYFTDRGIFNPDDLAKSDNGLFLMRGSLWRAVRNKLSPTFTSGKLKVMFDSMVDCYKNLESEIDRKMESKKNIEARDIMFAYTSDIIASCAFGMDVNKDQKSSLKFREMGMKAFKMDVFKLSAIILMANFPKLIKYLKISFISSESIEYFGNVLTEALKFRRETGYLRNDFLQLLMQIKDKGSVEHHGADPEDDYLNISKSTTTESFEFTEDLLMAQAFTFITAGMEPSANTLTFACAELARNQDIQERVRSEIEEVLEKHNNEFTYQSLRDMEYLELCILETLRLYPVAKQLIRVCTRRYDIEKVTLDFGTTIIIPVKALHTDPRYFTNPLDFNPDRFEEPTHPVGCFLPFGDGPRICIGMRFAMVEMKVALCKLIQNYRLSPGENFTYPIPLNRLSFFSVPSKPVNIRLQKIK